MWQCADFLSNRVATFNPAQGHWSRPWEYIKKKCCLFVFQFWGSCCLLVQLFLFYLLRSKLIKQVLMTHYYIRTLRTYTGMSSISSMVGMFDVPVCVRSVRTQVWWGPLASVPLWALVWSRFDNLILWSTPGFSLTSP